MSQRVVDLFIKKYGRLPTEFDPDYLEMLRMSKYRILAVPDFKPGTCANCGSAKNDGRQYIDFGVVIDFFGTVYFCGFCLKDIANNMGLFQSFIDEIGMLKAELLSIKVQQKKDTNLEEKLLHIFREVKDYLDGIHSTSDDSTSDTGAVLDINTSDSESGVEQTKPRTIKSDSSKRSTDVPSLAKLLTAGSE